MSTLLEASLTLHRTSYRSSIIALHSAAAQRVAYEKALYEESLLELKLQ